MIAIDIIQVFNHNLVKDDLIGSFPLDLVSLSQIKSLDLKVSLEDASTGKISLFFLLIAIMQSRMSNSTGFR